MKGEASGNTQKIIEILPDCENNSLLLLVDQKGPHAIQEIKHVFTENSANRSI